MDVMRYFIGLVGLLLATVVSLTPISAQDNILGLPELAIASQGTLIIGGGGHTPHEARSGRQ